MNPPFRLHRSGTVSTRDTGQIIGTVSPTSARFGDWPEFRQFKATTKGGAELGSFPNRVDAGAAIWRALTVENLR